jgi:hypothetical protein
MAKRFEKTVKAVLQLTKKTRPKQGKSGKNSFDTGCNLAIKPHPRTMFGKLELKTPVVW